MGKLIHIGQRTQVDLLRTLDRNPHCRHKYHMKRNRLGQKVSRCNIYHAELNIRVQVKLS